MSSYYVFFDECGCHNDHKTKRFLSVHSYYVRTALIFLKNDWDVLRSKFPEIKKARGLPPDSKLKWSFTHLLEMHWDEGTEIPYNKPYKYLEEMSKDNLLGYFEDCLKLISKLESVKIFSTYTLINMDYTVYDYDLLKRHFNDKVTGIANEFGPISKDTIRLFLDPESRERDYNLGKIYNQIFSEADILADRNNIGRELQSDYSKVYIGLQLADHISGALCSFLNNDPEGSELFMKYVYGHLYRRKGETSYARGMKELPFNSKCDSYAYQTY